MVRLASPSERFIDKGLAKAALRLLELVNQRCVASVLRLGSFNRDSLHGVLRYLDVAVGHVFRSGALVHGEGILVRLERVAVRVELELVVRLALRAIDLTMQLP